MPKKIIILKGLSGSGKSTWAKEQVKEDPNGTIRINKDDMRAMYNMSNFSRHNENYILKMRDEAMLQALSHGFHTVIIDDTNLHKKHETKIRELIAEYNKKNNKNVQVIIRDDFLEEIPIDLCIERDLKRTNSVGEKVIRRQYRDYLKWNNLEEPKVEKPERNPDLPSCIICDLDGTLALMKDRSPYEWDKVGQDHVNPAVKQILEVFHYGPEPFDRNDISIIILSGRDGSCYNETKEWLRLYEIPCNELYLREAGDTRADDIIKKKLYEKNILGKYNVDFVLDDRQRVVDMWRKKCGLTVFQVDYGDF